MSLVDVHDGATVRVDQARILQTLKLNPNDPRTQALLLVCQRYGLDPLLKHMVLISGNPYVTRDGYLHVAHMSGQFDGMETVDEGETEEHWWAKVSVYRKDMSRPFTYRGRYPKADAAHMTKFGPEMAVKCAEVASLRRAFDVTGIGAADEQWDAGHASESVEWSTEEQRERIKELSGKLDDNSKAAAREFVDEHSIDLKRLTGSEAETVIDWLEGLLSAQTADEEHELAGSVPPTETEGNTGATGLDEGPNTVKSPAPTPVEADPASRTPGEGRPADGAEEDAEPPSSSAPTTYGGPPMSAKLRAKLFAVVGNKLNPPDDLPNHERDDWRRNELLALCQQLGYLDIESRTQIGADLAGQVIELLEGDDQ